MKWKNIDEIVKEISKNISKNKTRPELIVRENQVSGKVYKIQSEGMEEYFSNHKKNTEECISQVLLKCTILNSYYATGVRQIDLLNIARIITDKETNFDSRVASKDLSLVLDILDKFDKSGLRNYYSFTTKYCANHNGEYPIFDSIVKKIMVQTNSSYKFTKKLKLKDLKDYDIFSKQYEKFMQFFTDKTKNCNLAKRDFDRIVWVVGKNFDIK
jgi:hypothetical protein